MTKILALALLMGGVFNTPTFATEVDLEYNAQADAQDPRIDQVLRMLNDESKPEANIIADANDIIDQMMAERDSSLKSLMEKADKLAAGDALPSFTANGRAKSALLETKKLLIAQQAAADERGNKKVVNRIKEQIKSLNNRYKNMK